ncbi:trypsin-like serine protease, partial [Pseudomonas sp. 100_A]|uniref:trypsin-like serine peptidase n=1 Tax=Pseudomonas sp. 100_A TaxID=2813571 RepID=UPI001A9CC922
MVELGAFRWTVQAWPEQTFQTGSNETLTTAESQYDIALIGLSQAVGDQVGWFGVASGYNDWQQAYQIGYPSDGTGMMLGTAWVDRNSLYSVYRADASTGSDIMAPGSSGGPLFILDELGDPYVIGVRSSGSATTSYWADVDLLYEQIVLAMGENDSLLP